MKILQRSKTGCSLPAHHRSPFSVALDTPSELDRSSQSWKHGPGDASLCSVGQVGLPHQVVNLVSVWNTLVAGFTVVAQRQHLILELTGTSSSFRPRFCDGPVGGGS